jgi:hypothetical protein
MSDFRAMLSREHKVMMDLLEFKEVVVFKETLAIPSLEYKVFKETVDFREILELDYKGQREIRVMSESKEIKGIKVV